ncbi:MAG: hypothetical protein AABY15_02225 [Nanoarchaeota archaeon]|mgnify:CR=1 FL=1
MYYIAAATIEGQHILLINKDQSLSGAQTIEEAKKSLPNYKGRHGMGREWSASAMIHWMQFNPRLFRFESLDAIQEVIHEERSIKKYRCDAGSVTGVLLKEGYEPEVVAEAELI